MFLKMRTLWCAFFLSLIYMNLTEFNKSSESERPHYLLFGHPVEHSLSPLMHNTALKHLGIDAKYFAIDLLSNELSDLAAFMNRDTFLGGNVTIPYKQLIADYLDNIAPSAREIGAINTIVKKQYHLEGYNTDCVGFLAPLKEFEIEGETAIIFGTGGASRAIVVSLINSSMETIYLVSRTPNRISAFNECSRVRIISYNEWTNYAEESMLIVNATPLGMYPNIEKSPIRDAEKKHLAGNICYDIVYNPLRTKFLRQAEAVGATTINGLEMLIQQGNRAFKLWTGQLFPLKIVRNTLYEKLAD